jgi:hypothetical protein
MLHTENSKQIEAMISTARNLLNWNLNWRVHIRSDAAASQKSTWIHHQDNQVYPNNKQTKGGSSWFEIR